MSAPASKYPVRSILAISGLALLALACLARPALAAGMDPSLPAISIMDVKKGEDKLEVPPATTKGTGTSAGKGSGNKGNGGSQGGGNSSTPKGEKQLSTVKGNLTYIISLRNVGKFSATNVQLEYHFYNKTTFTENGVSDTPTITDITSIENVDIDAGKMKDIQTQSIPHENTQNQAPGTSSGGGRNKTLSSSTYSSTITTLLGWHIEVRYNDKLIQKRDYPDNLQDLLKKYTPATP